jgi:hypothetical protein
MFRVFNFSAGRHFAIYRWLSLLEYIIVSLVILVFIGKSNLGHRLRHMENMDGTFIGRACKPVTVFIECN